MKLRSVLFAAATGVALGTVVGVAHASGGSVTVELSAPIFPKVLTLYAHEGASYPSLMSEKEDLVDDAALAFSFLLNDCAATYPAITLSSGSAPLTSTQLTDNYNAVAECSYATYTSKPYWIPKLVDEVDICARTLGAGWRLPTEADVNAFTPAELSALASTLSTVAGSSSSWMGSFYFSMRIYVRGTDGSLKIGDLTPGSTSRISTFGLSDEAMKSHYEGSGTPLALRCLQETTTP